MLLKEGKLLRFASALLEFLIWKKELNNRVALIEPLFRLLGKIVKEDWPLQLGNQGQQEIRSLDNAHKSRGSDMCYVQQVVMTVLESISSSLTTEFDSKADICRNFNVDLVVFCVNVAKDSSTRNHALSLLTALAKLIPNRVLDHVIDIFTVIGESTITQGEYIVYEMLDIITHHFPALPTVQVIVDIVEVELLNGMGGKVRLLMLLNLVINPLFILLGTVAKKTSWALGTQK
eukprot:Gb_31974 [translate_table: standard]